MADITLKKVHATGAHSFQSDKRLFLTKDGRVVEEGDPDANELLVRAGGTIDARTAERLHLTEKGQQLPKGGEVVHSTARGAKPEAAPLKSPEKESGVVSRFEGGTSDKPLASPAKEAEKREVGSAPKDRSR
jgi:hypothetical protein